MCGWIHAKSHAILHNVPDKHTHRVCMHNIPHPTSLHNPNPSPHYAPCLSSHPPTPSNNPTRMECSFTPFHRSPPDHSTHTHTHTASHIFKPVVSSSLRKRYIKTSICQKQTCNQSRDISAMYFQVSSPAFQPTQLHTRQTREHTAVSHPRFACSRATPRDSGYHPVIHTVLYPAKETCALPCL